MKAYGMRQRDNVGETCPCCKNSKGWGKGNRPARKRARQSANKQVTEMLPCEPEKEIRQMLNSKKITWCENWIRATFKKENEKFKQATGRNIGGIERNHFFELVLCKV